MSRRKRESSTPMPMSSAGLMRFFQDEAKGVRIRPELVAAWAIILIIMVILAHILFPI
ncbi:preprotein translocase subunit Sec61beta [Candidatus Bathyarchaeota archaeon]|nr:preprotein translocase subunit Sec61beta [Candidatus Bathyarchaeota archaeon]